MSVVTGLSPDQIEAILVHELAHVRRHDYAINVLQTLIETVFFYHPAVWWLSRQIRYEREHCCDDVAVAAIASRVEYGRALLALEEQRGASTVLALGARDGSLLARVLRLHSRRQRLAAWQPAAMAAVAVAPILLIATGLWTIVRADERVGTSTAAVMSEDEQKAWRELETTGATLHGEAARRQHLRRHLASLEQIRFPASRRAEIREQLKQPVRSASLWHVPPAAWPLVARLQSLRELTITASDLDRDAFRRIAKLPELQSLQVVNAGCQPLDAAPLKDATALERIDITFTVFDASAAQRAEWLGELTEAEQSWADAYRRSGGREHIVEAALLTDRMLQALLDLPNLEALRLVNTSVSPLGVKAISSHPGLEELDASLVDFTPEAAREIGRLTKLRRFRTANASDETLAAFSRLTELESLELWAEGVTDAAIEHLLSLRSLQDLALRGSSISDVGLLELATLPRLKRLDLRHAKGALTPEGLAAFQRRNPRCRLVVDEARTVPAQADAEESDRGAEEENAEEAGERGGG